MFSSTCQLLSYIDAVANWMTIDIKICVTTHQNWRLCGEQLYDGYYNISKESFTLADGEVSRVHDTHYLCFFQIQYEYEDAHQSTHIQLQLSIAKDTVDKTITSDYDRWPLH